MTDESDVQPEGDEGLAKSAGSFEKTPMFTAENSSRYQRQAIIKEIEALSEGRQLICYVAGENADIDRDDTIGFNELLYKIAPGSSIDLLLHTPGGDVDAAEKLISMVQATVGGGSLRAIVPDYAKSAGTLITLGANQILMSNSSELGTIDPQVHRNDGCGSKIYHSVLSYIRAYTQAEKALKSNPNDLASQIMFGKFDPVVVQQYEAVAGRAKVLGENLLKPMGVNYTQIVADLMNIERFPSHGQPIGWDTAQKIGLPIEYLEKDDPIWKLYWSLYCHLRLAINKDTKIFESHYVSLPWQMS
jgi:Serine dehydrogenase proteinase